MQHFFYANHYYYFLLLSCQRTPLAMACIEGHTEIVELLLSHGANVSVTDENEVRETIQYNQFL